MATLSTNPTNPIAATDPEPFNNTASTSNKRKRSPSPYEEEEDGEETGLCVLSPSLEGASGNTDSCSTSSSGNLAALVPKTSSDFTSKSILGPSRKKRKGVTFDGVTVFYFRRSQGFTSVPSQGGSTLGMQPKHECKRSFSLCDYSMEQERIHRIILKRQLIEKRLQQLLENGATELTADDVSEEEIEDELNTINISDYYFLQPIPTKQRRALLRIAGIKKVDNVEKVDLKKIRISRENCGCDCRNFCNPSTCSCAQAGIKCQVDRLSFPCGCTKEGCANPTGRVEFNPVRVRTHFLHTIMRLDMEQDGSGGDGPSSSSSDDGIKEDGEDYTTSASCTKPCCDNSAPLEENNAITGYSNSMLGPFNNRQSNHLFGHQYDGHGVETGIPIEVKQHLNVQDFIPRMLHYNDMEDTMLHHHNHVGLCDSDSSVPPLATYPPSDDSMLTSSSDTSSSDSYQYNQCDEFAFKGPTAFTEISKASEVCVSSSTDSSFSGVPGNKLSALEEASDFHLGLPLCTNTTFTDLSTHTTTFAGEFGSSAITHPPSCRPTTTPSSYASDAIDSQASQAEPSPFNRETISTTPDPALCTTTTSSYTILSALNAIDPLDETELATSKISSVPVSIGDNFSSSVPNHSGDFHELQNCSSADVAVSKMVGNNCSDLKAAHYDTIDEKQPLNCFNSIKNGEELNKDKMVASGQLA